MTQNNLLSQLKDIHQPTPVSWWPPAIGWYLLVIVICITAFIIGKLLYKRWRKYIRKKCALAELKQLKIAYQNTPNIFKVPLSVNLPSRCRFKQKHWHTRGMKTYFSSCDRKIT